MISEARTNTRISCRREITQNRTKEKLNGPLYWQAGITTVERSIPETASQALRSVRHKSLQAVRAQWGKPARKGGKVIYLETGHSHTGAKTIETDTKTIERRLGKAFR
jgi:starvation-inducible outer membrane lipoprotein